MGVPREAGSDVLGQIREDTVIYLAACAVQDEQPTGVPGLGRALCYQTCRQVVVEVVGEHTRSFS